MVVLVMELELKNFMREVVRHVELDMGEEGRV